MKRVILLLLMLLFAIAAVYLSRFWLFNLWPRSGLFGIEELRPTGGLLARWLRGTQFAPFELLIWVVGGFLTLTWMQKIYDILNPPEEPEKEDAHDG